MIQEKALTVEAERKIAAAVPPDKSIIQNKSLNLFQKILLTTDGTVTNLVSLYTGESIKVRKVAQDFVLSGQEEILLCPPGTPVLKRNILLCGETKNYIYAESIFVFERLSRSTQYKLLETDQPIGLLWKEEKLDSYRQIMEYKFETCGSLAEYFDGTVPETPLLSRTYLVYHRNEILGIISEKFPIHYFKEMIV